MSGGRERLIRLRQALREVVYPEGAICLGCGRRSDGNALCPECRRELLQEDLLESWETRDLDGVPAWSMRPHRGISRKLILRLKHGAETRAAGELAAVFRERPGIFPELPENLVVTWVPSPGSRIRERCVDHGRALAEALAREANRPCAQLLRRRGNDRPQVRLSREKRERNLKNAFQPVGPIRTPVLLVDDVLTTGTTARRCVAALREAGAREILVLTATHAARQK